jgi:hypothetical protein
MTRGSSEAEYCRKRWSKPEWGRGAGGAGAGGKKKRQLTLSMANQDPWRRSAGGRITDSSGVFVKWEGTEINRRRRCSADGMGKRQSIHLFIRLFGTRED